MDINDLMTNAAQLTDYKFKQKLNKLVRENYRYKNLDKKNRKVILDLMKKYKSNIRKGIGISGVSIRNERYKLRKNHIKLGLSEEDLEDIEEILKEFRK